VPVQEEPHPFVLHLPLGTRLADAERKLIVMTLEALHGNKLRAARILGISRRGLYSKLEAYDESVAAADAPANDAAGAARAEPDPRNEPERDGPPPA
jgi:DNA-binding NtrC family response regulator